MGPSSDNRLQHAGAAGAALRGFTTSTQVYREYSSMFWPVFRSPSEVFQDTIKSHCPCTHTVGKLQSLYSHYGCRQEMFTWEENCQLSRKQHKSEPSATNWEKLAHVANTFTFAATVWTYLRTCTHVFRKEANNPLPSSLPIVVARPIEAKMLATARYKFNRLQFTLHNRQELAVGVIAGFQKCNTLLHHTNTAHTDVGKLRLSTGYGCGQDIHWRRRSTFHYLLWGLDVLLGKR